MAGTITASVVKNDTTSPPTFQNSAGTQIGTLCRAWVNFNGIGTVAIRASFNVSSITDNGTGNYTVNFTNAMPDADYSAQVTASNIADLDGGLTTTTIPNLRIYNDSGSAVDTARICVAVFR